MGGGGGSIYTAYTFYLDLDCKLDEGRLLYRLIGGCYIAGLSQRRYIIIYVYVSPPGEQI